MSKGKAIAAALVLAGLLVLVLLHDGSRDAKFSGGGAPAPAGDATLPTAALPVALPEGATPQAIAPSESAVSAPAAPAASAVPPRSHVFGLITDLRDAPIAGVAVRLGSVGVPWADEAVYPDIPPGHTYSLVTDASGRFSFETPLPSSNWITLMLRPPPLYQRDGRDFGEAGGRNRDPLRPGDNDLGTIRLADAGAFEGTVRDGSGQPLEAVVVQLEGSFPGGYSANGFSDADGHYVVGGVPEGNFRVSAERHGVASGERDGVAVHVGQITPGIDFRLEAASRLTIAGQVVDDAGAPIAGADVDAWPVGSGRSGSATSGDDGRFEVELAQAGPHTFEVELEGFETLRTQAAAQPGDTDVRLVLKRRPTAALRIVDATSGAPLARCGAALDWNECIVAEHADGRIDLPVALDRDSLRVEADGHVPRWVQLGPPSPEGDGRIAPGADGVYVVPLQPELVATVSVVHEGAPVPHPVLRIKAAELPPDPAQREDDDPYNDDDPSYDVPGPAGHERALQGDSGGRGRIGQLTAGHWLLTIRAPGVAPRDVPFVVAAKDVDLGEIALTRGGAVEGRAVAPAGSSTAGLVIGLDTGPYVDNDLGATFTLDASGAFHFECLAPGPHLVFAGAAPGVVRAGEGWPVNIVEGQTAKLTLDLAAHAPHRLEVDVLVNGAPAEGLRILLQDVARGSVGMLGTTDARGVCSAETDGCGPAKLLVLGGSHAPVATLDAVLRPGESTRHPVAFDAGRLRVRLLPSALKSAAALVALHVERVGEEDHGGYGVQPKRLADDLYELGLLLPGRYRAVTLGQDEEISAEVEIVAGHDAEVSLGSP